jgi:hypothetical protein
MILLIFVVWKVAAGAASAAHRLPGLDATMIGVIKPAGRTA